MGIDLYWDDDAQTVMLVEFNGAWAWDELHAVLSTIKRISDERGQVFGAIVDIREGLQLPGGSIFSRESLKQFQRMLSVDQNGKKGPMVIVGMNIMVRNIFDAVRRFDADLTDTVTFASTMDDARKQIYSAVRKIG